LEKVDGAARPSKPPRWKREVELMVSVRGNHLFQE
jgi:hypothetical protein